MLTQFLTPVKTNSLKMEEEGVDWLLDLLQQVTLDHVLSCDPFAKFDNILSQVQLEQFFVRIRDELQVSRMQHFEYVQSEDLEKVGMSKPAAKRLLDIIKRRRLKNKLTKFLPTVGKFGTLKRWAVAILVDLKNVNESQKNNSGL